MNYLEVVLQVIDEERHVVTQPPPVAVSSNVLHVASLHLESPTLLQFELNTFYKQQEFEDGLVPAKMGK